MSQMSEESENRNLQVQQIEENLATIKNCSEYLQKRYENIKQIYEEIKTKDIESEGYQCGIQEILKLSKSTYKKAKKKLETLNITVSKESEPCTSEKLLTNSETSDLSIIESETNVNSLKGDSQIVTTEPSINQEDMGSILSRNTLQCDNQKESTDNDPDTSCAQHNGSEGIPSVDATLEPKSNSIPAIDADAQPTSAAASVSRSVSAESLKTFPTNVNENGNINSELEKNTTTTNNNNPPKGTIRLVSLEKLLDPKIASLQKRNSRKTSQIPDPNDSVIILDSDEDNDQVVKTTSENATRSKKTASKPESRISVSTKEDRLNTDVNINNRQRKIKRSAVRIKSNKLIDKMIAEGKNTIKVTPKYMGRIDSLVDEDLFKKLTSRDTSKRKREILVKKKTTERRTVELSVSSPEDDCNDDGKKESNGTVKKGIKIRIRRFSVTSNMSKDKDPDNSSNKNENNSDSEDDNITSRNVTPNGSSEKCGNEEKNSHTEETANHEKSNASESSDGEIVRKKPKRTKASSSSEIEKSTKDDDLTKKSKKRKRIKQASSDTSGSEKENANTTRKNIRKVLKIKDLGDITKKAAEEEASRRKRIEERQKLYNQIYEQPEAVELKELVLDFDETTKEPILSVDPGILKKLKPHQAGGIKFMWDACFETLKDTKEKSGSGCILAHCMGLGKTLQVVTLIHTLMTNSEKTNVERALVITPLSTVTNWAKEFKMWMRFCKNKNIEIYDMSKWREKNLRVSKTNEWFEEGGVCIMGYDMFRTLVNVKSATLKKKQRDILQKCLIEPGPDIVICDEGHLLKNEKTSLSQAVNRITTKRRIVLTGTPLQNNLKEYYCMIQFIKPNLLGTYKEYLNRFVNPITNGQYTDSTERDIKLMRHRSHVLHKLLEGCIQRKDYSVLAPYLPPKYEYVIFITLSEIQKKLYKFYMTQQKDIISEAQYGGKGAMLFQDFQSLRRIWTHPLCLRMNSINVIRKKLEQEPSESEGSLADFVVHGDSTTPTPSDSSSSESDDDEKPKSENKTVSKRRTRLNPGAADIESEPDNIGPEVISDPSEWWKAFCQEEDLMNINNSPKLILLLEVLQNCEALGDKVLLFSQSLQSLDVIEHFLSLIDSKTHGNEIEGDVGDFTGSWTPGLDYFRLDGSCSVEAREEMCKRFNDTNNLRGRLFLISTRAGSLGINLVAANRVIIFDVSWNPSYDTQSIFRVYRFGQTKPSYIYRFITLGTMEQKVYERQVIKQATAKRVVDEQQIGRHYNQSDLLELYKYEVEPVQPREVPPLPKDRLFADILAKHENIIYKYHDHNSLLENEESEILSEEERKAAWAEYQEEKDRPAQQFTAYPRGPYNGPVTSNKTFGFRNDILLKLLNLMVKGDHPAITDEEAACLVPVYLHRFYDQMNNRNTEMYSQLVQLHRQLEVPQGQYFPQMAQYPTQGPPPMGGIHPMSLMNMQQNPYMNPTPHSNQSHVYEID